jgi:hypothetical protein
MHDTTLVLWYSACDCRFRVFGFPRQPLGGSDCLEFLYRCVLCLFARAGPLEEPDGGAAHQQQRQ